MIKWKCTRLKRSITCSDFVSIYISVFKLLLYMDNLNRNVTSSCLHNDHGGEALMTFSFPCVSCLPPKLAVSSPTPSISGARDLPASKRALAFFFSRCKRVARVAHPDTFFHRFLRFDTIFSKRILKCTRRVRYTQIISTWTLLSRITESVRCAIVNVR